MDVIAGSHGRVAADQVGWTVGTEATNAITITAQLEDAGGAPVTEPIGLMWYLASAANGLTYASAPSGGIAIGSDGIESEYTANISGVAVTKADGTLQMVLTDTGTPTFYVVIVLPSGRLAISPAVTFA